MNYNSSLLLQLLILRMPSLFFFSFFVNILIFLIKYSSNYWLICYHIILYLLLSFQNVRVFILISLFNDICIIYIYIFRKIVHVHNSLIGLFHIHLFDTYCRMVLLTSKTCISFLRKAFWKYMDILEWFIRRMFEKHFSKFIVMCVLSVHFKTRYDFEIH